MKVLVVAFLTPPFSQVGSVRVSKFIKFLSRSDNNVSVITANSRAYGSSVSDSYMEDFENADKIIRTFAFKRFKFGPKEEGIYWFPFLTFALISELIKNRPDVVYFTGGPFFHWVCAPLLKLFNIRYVLDFRDPWVLSPYAKKSKGLSSKFLHYLAGIVEGYAIKYAGKVINVTDPATQMYKKYYSEHGSKFETIPNGFDSDDFSCLSAKSITKFDIVYTGKFGDFRDPSRFFVHLRQYIDNNHLTPADIGFVWLGQRENAIVDLIEANRLTEYVHLLGMKTYKECLEYVKGAGACLLISGDHPYEPTTKIFDYMALRKNVVSYIGTQGFLSELLDELGVKYFVKAREYEHKFEEILCQSVNDTELCLEYERSRQAEKLLKIFESL